MPVDGLVPEHRAAVPEATIGDVIRRSQARPPCPHALASLLSDPHLPPVAPVLARLLEPSKRRSPPSTGCKLQRRHKQGSSSSITRPWKPRRPRKLQGQRSRREQPGPWTGDRHRHGAPSPAGFGAPRAGSVHPQLPSTGSRFFPALLRRPRPSSRHGRRARCFPDVRKSLVLKLSSFV